MEPKARVILYSRPGCHLCDEMKQAILAADCAHLFTLEEVNIEDGSELLSQYRYDIPVLSIDGVEAFKHRLTTIEFKSALSRGLRK